MVTTAHRSFIDELVGFDRLLEIGMGARDDLAVALRERGRTVVAVDVSADAVNRTGGPAVDVDVRRADVVSLADAADPIAALDAAPAIGRTERDRRREPIGGVDAVYARNLPAELQRPTVALARRLDATCLFTTLGFEGPVVPVKRLTRPGTTLFLVERTDGSADGTGPIE